MVCLHCILLIDSSHLLFFLLPYHCLLSFPFVLSLLSAPFPSSTLVSSDVAIRGQALRQTIQTVTSVLGSPLPPLPLATLPLTPTHTRPWLTPPWSWGKGRYSCMIVTMKGCFRVSRFYRRNIIGSCWDWISVELLSNIIIKEYMPLKVVLTCFIKQFACFDPSRQWAVSKYYSIYFTVKF